MLLNLDIWPTNLSVDATGDDLKLVQRILKNADENIRQTPTCETRDEVLLIINMLQAQVDIDLGALD